MADTLLSHEETPDVDILGAQLLTLVHQHRELQRHLLDAQLGDDGTEQGTGGRGPVPTFAQILVERQSTQRRLLELPEQRLPAPHHAALQQLAEGSGPTASVYTGRAAAQHFKDLLLALQQEHRRAIRYACSIRNGTGSAETLLAGQGLADLLSLQASTQLSNYLQALVLAQADAAARAARLKDGFQLQQADLEAMAAFALLHGPAERLGARFASRIQCLPWSHNHRFLIYEQVAGEDRPAIARRQSPELRLPGPVTTRAASHAAVTQLLKHFGVDDMQLPAVQAREAHLQHAYLSNKVTSEVSQGLQQLPVLRSKIVAPVQPERAEKLGTPFLTEVPENASAGQAAAWDVHKVELIADCLDVLQSLAPSLQGDLSAGYAAALDKASISVDEELYAENKFLDEHDGQHATVRLMFLARQHAARYHDAGAAEDDDGMTFSVAHVADQLQGLDTKTLEALYSLRFLHTRQSKLQVLHFCNAAVFVMMELLQDEQAEEQEAEQQLTTPFEHMAHSPDATAATAATAAVQGVGVSGVATDGSATSKPACKEVYAAEVDSETGLVHIFRSSDHQEVFHQYALEMFNRIEQEVLLVSSHLLDNRKASLEAVKRAHMPALDKMEVLMELWEAEAAFCAAKHELLGVITTACFQASGTSVAKLRGAPSAAAAPAPARQYLRQLSLDTVYRRPNFSLDELYFRDTYRSETSSLTTETKVVRLVMQNVAAMQWDSLQQAAASALVASGESQPPNKLEDCWRPGLAPIMLLSCSDDAAKRMKSFQNLPTVGMAISQLYQTLTSVMTELAAVHQVKHYQDVCRLRKAVMEHVLLDFQIFEKEEAFRQHSQSQAKLLDGASAMPHNRRGGAHAEFSGNFLQPSLVGDDTLLVLAIAQQQKLPAKQLLEVVLLRDELLRHCYTAEVWWLLYQVQSRALGWKINAVDLKPLNWDNIDAEGHALRGESVADVMSVAEPDDVAPPHASGPPGADAVALPASHERHGSTPAVGRNGLIGCVWRAPNIAFNEFCDDLACALDVHSLPKLQALLQPGSVEAAALQTAVQSEKLRAATIQLTVQHNQVLLDQVIRAMFRRQNVLLNAASTSHAKRLKHEQQHEADAKADPSILSWAPKTIRGEVARRASLSCVGNQLVEGGASRVAGQLREYRRDLVHAVQPLCLELQQHKIEARKAARKHFATVVRQHNQGAGRSHDTSTSKLKAHVVYVSELAKLLLPYAIKLDITRSSTAMVQLLLGSTGGPTATWGLLPSQPGQPAPGASQLQQDTPPFGSAGAPSAWLLRLLLEYGPLWQASDPEPSAASTLPPDLTKYQPVGGLPQGFCFPDDEGKFRLDQLTVLPSILDIVSWQPFCSSACKLAPLEQLEMAADTMRVLLALCQRHVFQESFQVAGSHIAQAGDITSGHGNQQICASVLAEGREAAQPPAVINTAVEAFKADQVSSLPGTVLGPVFFALKSIIDHLPRQTGQKQGSRAPLLKTVIQFLNKKCNLMTFAHLVAVARCNSYCTPSRVHSAAHASQGPTLRNAFVLEESLAAWLGGGPALPPKATALRLRDDLRLGVYNTMLEVSLLLEQAAIARNLQPLLAPLEAVQLQERLCTVLWVHDRLQEALLYRQAQMDAPFLFDGQQLSEAQYRKVYGRLKLLQPFCPSLQARNWMHQYYADTVIPQAQEASAELLEQAGGAKQGPVAASSGGHALPRDDTAGGSWEPAAGLLAEAAVKVMKQLLDRQCMLLATTKLKAGIQRLAAQCSALSSRKTPCAMASVLPNAKHAENASMTFLRRVFGGRGRQQEGQHQEGDEQMREVRKDDLLRWSQDFIRQASAECTASTSALLEGAELERQHLRQMIRDVQTRMHDFEARQAAEVQQRAVRVETQVLDRAMDMVATLGAMRRNKAQLQTLATLAVEKAYEKAHSQYAGRIEELERELEVARLNLKEVRAEMQQSALEALGEVKAEMMMKAFGHAAGLPRSPGSPGALLVGDGDYEGVIEARAEVAELQRAMAKIQAWFKIRSQAFQSACRSEAEGARKKVEVLQAENWEMREQHETELQNLQQHLAATQRQLEAVVGELQQRSMEVVSLTASNRRLLREKVLTMSARGRGGTLKGAASSDRPKAADGSEAQHPAGTSSRPGAFLHTVPTLRSHPSTPNQLVAASTGSLRLLSPAISSASGNLGRPGTPSGQLSRPGTPSVSKPGR